MECEICGDDDMLCVSDVLSYTCVERWWCPACGALATVTIDGEGDGVTRTEWRRPGRTEVG